MKIFENKIIPQSTIKQCVLKKCDLCGTESKRGSSWNGGYYEIAETRIYTEVFCSVGDSYSDGGGNGTKHEVDICPKCFKDKLIPWLKSQGANINEEEWDC